MITLSSTCRVVSAEPLEARLCFSPRLERLGLVLHCLAQLHRLQQWGRGGVILSGEVQASTAIEHLLGLWIDELKVVMCPRKARLSDFERSATAGQRFLIAVQDSFERCSRQSCIVKGRLGRDDGDGSTFAAHLDVERHVLGVPVSAPLLSHLRRETDEGERAVRSNAARPWVKREIDLFRECCVLGGDCMGIKLTASLCSAAITLWGFVQRQWRL